jgi:hypothetical protein
MLPVADDDENPNNNYNKDSSWYSSFTNIGKTTNNTSQKPPSVFGYDEEESVTF